MPVFETRSVIDATAEEVFAWHGRPGAFERLVPPWESIRVVTRSAGIRDGTWTDLEVRKAGIRFRWVARHRGYDEGRGFEDVQVRGPFASWVHVHRFRPVEGGRSVLEDRVEYVLPGGSLGALVGDELVRASLQRLFRFRHERIRRDVVRHRAFAKRGPLRVVISGATGLVGRHLAAFLVAGGHRVDRLVRTPPDPDSTDVWWDPSTGEVDAARLEGADAVVHLAGESIAGRWTAARKAAILASRRDGTRRLATALARLRRPPRALVCASAIGYYGDRGDTVLGEDAGPGRGFLPEVCQAWEEATGPAASAGIRVVHLRIGMVLSASGGALARLLLPFRLGLGGPVGSGRQWVSWVGLDDLVGAIHHLLFAEEVSGPVNAVAPRPVTSREFARALGAVLGRPAFLPLPAPIVRVLLGEMGQALLLEGARVSPSRLLESGFGFLDPSLDAALRLELGRPGQAAR